MILRATDRRLSCYYGVSWGYSVRLMRFWVGEPFSPAQSEANIRLAMTDYASSILFPPLRTFWRSLRRAWGDAIRRPLCLRTREHAYSRERPFEVATNAT